MTKKRNENIVTYFFLATLLLVFLAYYKWGVIVLSIVSLISLPIYLIVSYIVSRTNILNLSLKEKETIIGRSKFVAFIALIIIFGTFDNTLNFFYELFLEGEILSKEIEVISDEGYNYFKDVEYFKPSTPNGKVIKNVIYFFYIFLIFSSILIAHFLSENQRKVVDKNEFSSKSPVILKCFIVVLLIIDIINTSQFYFTFIRWVLLFAIIGLNMVDNNENSLKKYFVFVFLGILFCPFGNIHFTIYCKMDQIISTIDKIMLIIFQTSILK